MAFLSRDSCQKRFLWTHKEADRALHPVVIHVLQERDGEKFPHTLGSFCQSASRVRAEIQEDGGDKRLVELALACRADGVAPPDPV